MIKWRLDWLAVCAGTLALTSCLGAGGSVTQGTGGTAVTGAAAGSTFVLYYGHVGITFKFPGMLAPLHVYPLVSVGYILFILALATGGAAMAALWPSVRASRMRPVEALSSV